MNDEYDVRVYDEDGLHVGEGSLDQVMEFLNTYTKKMKGRLIIDSIIVTQRIPAVPRVVVKVPPSQDGCSNAVTYPSHFHG